MKLTLQEIVDRLDDFLTEERASIIKAVMKTPSPISKQTMMEFQNSWEGSRSFEEFEKAQNEQLRTCIDIETYVAGDEIRSQFGLSPITMDEVIDDNS